MGKVDQQIADVLISPTPDRNSNRIRVYRKDNGEVVIHFRNIKITLLTPVERQQWKEGFEKALSELRQHNYFPNDL